MLVSEKCCSICSGGGEKHPTYNDGNDSYPVCVDCLAMIEERGGNPAKWHAFVVKHGNGPRWFEYLVLPPQAINKLHCK